MFSLTPSRNMSAGKSLKLERFLAALREHIICNVKRVEVRKMSVFWVKLYCKIRDLYRYFLLALRLPARKSEIKKKLWGCPWECLDEYKKVVLPKKEFHIWHFESFIFWSKFLFWGLLQGVFASFFFYFCRRPTMVSPLPPPPTPQKSFLRSWLHGFLSTAQFLLRCSCFRSLPLKFPSLNCWFRLSNSRIFNSLSLLRS